MAAKRFIIGDLLGFGWRVMTGNFWFFLGLALVAGILRALPNTISDILPLGLLGPPAILLMMCFTVAASFFVSTVINIGFIRIALRFCDGRKPPFATLFDFQGCFWQYVGTSVLHFLIVLAGSLLFIVPTVSWIFIGPEKVHLLLFLSPIILIGVFVTTYLTIKYGLCQYFVIDKGLGPVQAIKASARTTKGVMWKLYGFSILCTLIIFLGFLCLIVGIVAAYPIVLVANALVYRHLVAQTPELAEFQFRPRAPQRIQPINMPPPPMTLP